MIEQASLVIGEGNWAVKSDSLLGYKINGGKYYPREMSVVRATTGTRINEDGLVELVPYNYIQYSELFSDASWTKTDSNIVGGFISPTGDANASKLSVTAANGIIQKPVSLTDLRTVSIYAKRGTHQYLRFGAYGGTNSYGNFDLENGVITSGANTQIEDVGNGWYRCTCHSANGTTGGVQIFSSNSPTGAATTAGDIYIWGAQANEGSSALDYLPTTDRLDVARIDYSSGSGALLVEPQRTNLALYSSSFDNAAWTSFFGTITANNTIAPDGTLTADRLNSTTNTYSGIYQSIGTLASTVYTYSIYAKAGTNNYLCMLAQGNGNERAFFNLNTGTVGATQNIDSASIESVGNGWYRCQIQKTCTGIEMFVFSSNIENTTPTANGNIYLWGAQLELGSYATSLIPTQAATVTRNADVISKTGIADLIGQTEGTLFAEIYADQAGSANNWFEIYDGTSNNWIFLGKEGITMRGYIRTSGTTHFDNTTFTITDNAPMKVALAYKSGDNAFYINGTLIASSSSSFTINNSISIVNFGFGLGTVGDSSAYKAAALYKTRLTNAELATLTTI
jgi:hypothetical protein